MQCTANLYFNKKILNQQRMNGLIKVTQWLSKTNSGFETILGYLGGKVTYKGLHIRSLTIVPSEIKRREWDHPWNPLASHRKSEMQVRQRAACCPVPVRENSKFKQERMQHSVKGSREKLYVYAPLFTGHWGNAKNLVMQGSVPQPHLPNRMPQGNHMLTTCTVVSEQRPKLSESAYLCSQLCHQWQDLWLIILTGWHEMLVPTVGPTITIPSKFFLVWKSSLQILSARIVQQLKLEKIPMSNCS